ncbi:hypothetical protein RHSIM_Rhsim05G0211900 [Rhododendron simsii]|uniref:Sieve element occlusion C-terminal domain-containing protein n=1 Tax=Rhododendron simsii TaxID=118357 RepID=A0A834H1V9_RHOSS|nr:hypothetical protein RHSIM_Rhsim05G0211900 [Rhododendron simsii]
MVQEIMAMLSFDGSDQGWAVISHGSAEMAKANGDTILKSLTQFEQWKEQAGQAGFVAALNQNLHDLHTPHHCSRLILPEATCGIPERVACPECGRQMEKFIMYRCCTDEAGKEWLTYVTVVNPMSEVHVMAERLQVFGFPRRTALKVGLRVPWGAARDLMLRIKDARLGEYRLLLLDVRGWEARRGYESGE